jgi:hypothetical protein
VPAVVLIITLLVFLDLYMRSEKGNLMTLSDFDAQNSYYTLLIPISLWSLYSLFLGFFNTNYSGEMISLAERFSRLPEGIYSQIFHSLGFPLMLLFISNLTRVTLKE